ncbi:MAG: hypothetical protein RMJ67_06330 [Elusimicrobiota bacterium]|nr:hypothetical protein [Endomicrobiia bacterium]MDW8166110.1 hypothetical protein [Elusimicrobiota bacterium]
MKTYDISTKEGFFKFVKYYNIRNIDELEKKLIEFFEKSKIEKIRNIKYRVLYEKDIKFIDKSIEKGGKNEKV